MRNKYKIPNVTKRDIKLRLSNMELTEEDIIDTCKAFNDLGWAIQAQVFDILHSSIDYCKQNLNYNAVERIKDFATEYNLNELKNKCIEILED